MKDWVSVEERLPELGDYSVLVYFSEMGSIDIVHVEDYFKDITAGVENGKQTYAKWYIPQKVSHWVELPTPPVQEGIE